MKSSTRLSWPGLLLGVAVVAWCGGAAANGRFPRAQRFVQEASEPARLALYGTYGLMTSADAGQSWQYICEGATGPFAGEAPLLELLPGGRLVLSTETGLRGSELPACTWRGLLEPALPNAVLDITRSPESESTLWALISEPEINVGFHSAVQRSDDGGESWSATERVPGDLLARGATIDVAPSRAERVYLSGLNALGSGVLLRSDDRAQTWQAFAVPGTTSTSLPYIAAVDPDSPDRLYLRSDTLELNDGEVQPNDALFFSDDGGVNVTRVFSRRAKLLGFALSPDGQTIALGYGDPVLFSYTVGPDQVGLYRARLADLLSGTSPAAAFEKVFAGNVTCLRWTTQGLYACLSQAEQGFELGRADDAEFSLDVEQPFEPLLDLRQVLPLSCGRETSAATCVSDANYGWPFVCTKLSADCSYGQGSGGAGGEPSEPAPSGGGGQGGVTGRAGAAGRGGDAVENADPGGTPRREKDAAGGCACGVRPSSGALGWAPICLVLMPIARRRRSRRLPQLDTKAP